MKVDDDTFVNLPLLYNQLTTSGQYRDLKYLLMGHSSLERAMAPLKPKRWKVIIALENINEYNANICNQQETYKWQFVNFVTFRQSLEGNLWTNGKFQIIYSME